MVAFDVGKLCGEPLMSGDSTCTQETAAMDALAISSYD
jgi:hypothetical protein